MGYGNGLDDVNIFSWLKVNHCISHHYNNRSVCWDKLNTAWKALRVLLPSLHMEIDVLFSFPGKQLLGRALRRKYQEENI